MRHKDEREGTNSEKTPPKGPGEEIKANNQKGVVTPLQSKVRFVSRVVQCQNSGGKIGGKFGRSTNWGGVTGDG